MVSTAAAPASGGDTQGGNGGSSTLVRLPTGPTPAAALPAPPKRVMAHAGGRMTVRYPDGYDPLSRSFGGGVKVQAGGGPVRTAAGSAPSTAAESEKLKKRMERFGTLSSGDAAVTAAAGRESGGGTEDDYERRYAEAEAEQARVRAQFLARKREMAAQPSGEGRRGGNAQKKPKASHAGQQGVLARLALPADGELRKQLQSRRG